MNWRLITLQYCSGFAVHSHESAMGVNVFAILNPFPPPSPSHPSGSSQCTSPEHPVSFIKPGLAIYFTYDNILVSMLFSKHPTLAFSHRVQKFVLYICVSCCLTYRVIVTIFVNSIYICLNILYWCFSFWLTSLCIIGSSFIYLIRTDSNAFFLMAM